MYARNTVVNMGFTLALSILMLYFVSFRFVDFQESSKFLFVFLFFYTLRQKNKNQLSTIIGRQSENEILELVQYGSSRQ